MTEINAELILASQHLDTKTILFTVRLTYPRYILAEVNTHRMLVRNTASSRAIPHRKMRAQVLNDPHLPIRIGKHQSGMQAYENLQGWREAAAYGIITGLSKVCSAAHWGLERLGVAKQVANRYIEPWIWTTQLISFTDIDNFLLQRDHPSAEPHIQVVAKKLRPELDKAKGLLQDPGFDKIGWKGSWITQRISQGDWHLPLVTVDESNKYDIEVCKKISAGRCANTSYYDIGDNSEITADKAIKIHDKLIEASPRHYSPLEHQAQALYLPNPQRRHGNFLDFVQYRKQFEGESGQVWPT